MTKYEYKIVEGKTQEDIETKMNGLAQTGYRLASFVITWQGGLRNQGAFRAVMERQLV